MLRQRVCGLAQGWEDLKDHAALRQDVAMQTAVGVDREVASAPNLCRLENWSGRIMAWRLHQVLVEQFIASFETAPCLSNAPKRLRWAYKTGVQAIQGVREICGLAGDSADGVPRQACTSTMHPVCEPLRE